MPSSPVCFGLLLIGWLRVHVCVAQRERTRFACEIKN